MFKNKGFTLIELLVVVLIIGILAAIVVPQYQKAVEKSKASQAFTLLKSVADAMRSYYLANSKWPNSFDQLDITIPPSFSGNIKAVPNNLTYGKSNEDWSLSFENISTGIGLYMHQISGKYKGSGFAIFFPSYEIYCYERKAGSDYLFDKKLDSSAFCKQIMQGKFITEDSWARYYSAN